MYKEKVKRELEILSKNLKKMKAWNIEIETLKEKMSAYRGGGFGSSSNSVVTIDDILARDETRLNTLESNIDYTNYKLRQYKACLEILTDREYEIINRKYLAADNYRTSFEKIGEDMYTSKNSVKRLHDYAIEKIADYMSESAGLTGMVQEWYENGTKVVHVWYELHGNMILWKVVKIKRRKATLIRD